MNILKLAEIGSCIASKKYNSLDRLLMPYKRSLTAQSGIYEAIHQSYLFCGFPAALESLKVFHSVFPSFKSVKNNLNFREFKVSGIKACKLIYGKNYNKLTENVNKLSPDLNEWMLVEGYGKILSRPGLSISDRELLNVALLCTNYHPAQLHSHIKGALNTGSTGKDINLIIRSTKKYNSKANIEAALSLASRVSS